MAVISRSETIGGVVRSVRWASWLALGLALSACSPAASSPPVVEPALDVPRLDGGSVSPSTGGIRFGRVPPVVGARWGVSVEARSALADPQGGTQVSEYISSYTVEVLATNGPAPSRVRLAFDKNVQRYQGIDKATAVEGKSYVVVDAPPHVRDDAGGAASEDEAQRVLDMFPDLGTRTQIDQVLPDAAMEIGDSRNELAGAVLRVIHPRAWTLNAGTAVLADATAAAPSPAALLTSEAPWTCRPPRPLSEEEANKLAASAAAESKQAALTGGGEQCDRAASSEPNAQTSDGMWNFENVAAGSTSSIAPGSSAAAARRSLVGSTVAASSLRLSENAAAAVAGPPLALPSRPAAASNPPPTASILPSGQSSRVRSTSPWSRVTPPPPPLRAGLSPRRRSAWLPAAAGPKCGRAVLSADFCGRRSGPVRECTQTGQEAGRAKPRRAIDRQLTRARAGAILPRS